MASTVGAGGGGYGALTGGASGYEPVGEGEADHWGSMSGAGAGGRSASSSGFHQREQQQQQGGGFDDGPAGNGALRAALLPGLRACYHLSA